MHHSFSLNNLNDQVDRTFFNTNCDLELTGMPALACIQAWSKEIASWGTGKSLSCSKNRHIYTIQFNDFVGGVNYLYEFKVKSLYVHYIYNKITESDDWYQIDAILNIIGNDILRKQDFHINAGILNDSDLDIKTGLYWDTFYTAIVKNK